MPIDIPRVSIRDQDRLVASAPGPSLLYAADGTGEASSSLPNLVVSLPTVVANEVVEISLPTVAYLLPVVGRKPTYGSNQRSRGNQPTYGSIPSSGSKPPTPLRNLQHSPPLRVRLETHLMSGLER